MGRLPFVICCLALHGIGGPWVGSAVEPCNPELEGASPRSYQWRGGYCEGLCSEPVSGEALELVSLWWRPLGPGEWLPSVPGGGRPADVLLRWFVPPGTAKLHLHLRSVDPLICYRLDAELPPSRKELRWSLDLAAALGLLESSNEPFGNLGLTLHAELESGRRVLVPIRVAPGLGRLEARVSAGQVLSSLEATLAGDGQLAGSRTRSEPKKRYFAADEVIPLSLDCHSGFADLELAARVAPTAGGGPLTRGYRLHLDCGATEP